jgi:hypothetical protein
MTNNGLKLDGVEVSSCLDCKGERCCNKARVDDDQGVLSGLHYGFHYTIDLTIGLFS